MLRRAPLFLRGHMSKLYGKIAFFLLLSTSYLPIVRAQESSFKPSFVASLSIGASFENAGQQQTIDLTPSVTKSYTASNLLDTLPAGELFVGFQNALPWSLEAQLGLAFLGTGHAVLTGDIWDDGDPTFDNYTYQYSVSRMALGLKGKVMGNWNFPVMPWIGATVALGFNKASSFSNTPTIPQAIASPNFTDNTTTVFTYAVSAGVEYKFSPRWQFGMGYEFSDWGAHSLGAVAGGTSPGLSLSHLFTHSVLLNVTYALEVF